MLKYSLQESNLRCSVLGVNFKEFSYTREQTNNKSPLHYRFTQWEGHIQRAIKAEKRKLFNINITFL